MSKTTPTPATPQTPGPEPVSPPTAAKQQNYPGVSVIPAKNIGTAYKLFFWLGIFGAHRFYLGKVGTGILWLLTGGLLGIGNIVDSFTLDTQVLRINQKNGVAPSGR